MMDSQVYERPDLMNAFNDCWERLQQGISVQECLNKYPDFSKDLRPLLELGQNVHTKLSDGIDTEAEIAKKRVRSRVLDNLYKEPVKKPINLLPYIRLAVASLLFILFASAFIYFTQQSLPGETLYPVKIGMEDAWQGGDNNARRITEIEHLLENGTVAEVQFEGKVASIENIDEQTYWQIDGLAVIVLPDTTVTGAKALDSLVAVNGYTTPRRELIASSIRVLDGEDSRTLTPTPTISPTPSLTPTATMTMMPTATNTPVPTPIIPYVIKPTLITPTATATPVPTLDANISCAVVIPDSPIVYVRTGGSNRHLIIDRLDSGATYPVIGVNVDNAVWYAVYLDDYQIAWFDALTIEPQGNCDYLPNLTHPTPPPLSATQVPVVPPPNNNGNGGSNNNGSGPKSTIVPPTAVPGDDDDGDDDGDDG